MTRLTASSDAGVGADPGNAEPRANITNLTIRWTFAADIKATQAADIQFQCLESALESADSDIRDALHLMRNQTGDTAADANSSLLDLAMSCFKVDTQAKALRAALSTYASAMDLVRSRFEGFISEASTHGMTVRGDYRGCTLSYEDYPPQSHAQYFFDLKPRVDSARNLYKLAEKEFTDALGKINTNELVQLFNEGVDHSKSSLVPSSDDYLWTSVGPVGTWIESAGNFVKGGRSWWHRAKYKNPKDFAKLSRWKRFTAKGNLSNYTMYGNRVAGNTSRLAGKVAGAAGKASKILGPAGAVVDGGLSAYDSYQSDTINYPKMGEGEKITRAGVKGGLSAGGAFAGAAIGAKGGAALGACVGGPIGAAVGGFAGGLIGGFAGSKAGQATGDWINRHLTKPFVKWWNS